MVVRSDSTGCCIIKKCSSFRLEHKKIMHMFYIYMYIEHMHIYIYICNIYIYIISIYIINMYVYIYSGTSIFYHNSLLQSIQKLI